MSDKCVGFLWGVAATLLVAGICFYVTIGRHVGKSINAGGHAANSPTPYAGPYAGQQSRAVASLSAEDVDGFLAGRGMGLAKAAELNGLPGPMHVLEHDKALLLTADQRTRVEAAMATMRAKAVALGTRYIDAEKAVDNAFKSGAATDVIAGRVADANRLLGDVRMAHLAAHLEITPLLSADQRTKYAALRGYGGSNHDTNKHKH